MAGLSVSELIKREWRIELFSNKMKNNEEFTLIDKRKVKLKQNKTVIEKLNLKNIKEFGGAKAKYFFETEQGELLTLTKFEKTKEFGGGTGSGAGTDITMLAECAFCVAACIFI